ncbi:MAG: molybdate ABC transporter substrate-binding protein [Alphaproteobacteria bacterium]
MMAAMIVWSGITLSARAANEPIIAAAADLKFALDEIANQFRNNTGRIVKLSFGSSGNFTRQIEQGGPFEMFLSADESLVFKLSDQGLTLDRGALYAVGRIVIFIPQGSPLKPDGSLMDLVAATADKRLKRFTIANPEHAPYGQAAMQALQKVGIWDKIGASLVLGENAAQATHFALSGSTQGGIIPYSLSLAPEVAKHGQAALIHEHLHAPLRQRMVLLKRAGETARLFFAYIQSPPSRASLKRYGFVLPDELP